MAAHLWQGRHRGRRRRAHPADRSNHINHPIERGVQRTMNVKISTWQLICLIFSFQVGLSLLLSITPAVQVAQQDAWISAALAGVGSFGIVFICTRLAAM